MTIASKSILIVDDDADILDLLTDLYVSEKCTVQTALSSESALSLLKNDPTIDVLLTDLRMPGPVNGYELGQQAKSMHQDIEVIIMTGHESDYVKAHYGNDFEVRSKLNLMNSFKSS